ncbi:MAG: transcription elongation factor GreA [Gammaproteobacteria bacterium]|nr:transcription elongation factor GreA [Gammaproteobacteria bacterium]
MSTTKYPMTADGFEALKLELHRLKSVERPRIVTAIAEARALGDLKENAEYHAAREQQSFSEGRILELEAKLSHAQVIDITKVANQGKVIFGSRVTALNLSTEKEVSYRIVGEDEANLKENKISYSSPLARAFIAKMVGDEAVVETPDGAVEYEILSVEY